MQHLRGRPSWYEEALFGTYPAVPAFGCQAKGIAMRFFMNVCDGHALVEDLDGSYYADEAGARHGAVEAARTFLADGDKKGECLRHWRFNVLDENRAELFQLPFMHAVAPASLKLEEALC